MSNILGENPDKTGWTEILEPSGSPLRLNLGEVWHYRDLLVSFIKRDFTATYKQTILGPLWFFIQPLFTTFIFTLIFGKFAKLSTDGLPYVPFYLSGLILWNFFSDSFIKISNTFNANVEIFSKVYFPRVIVPLSILCSSFIKFLIQLLLFLLILAISVWNDELKLELHSRLLIVPFLLLLIGGYAIGLGMLFSSLTVKYRDLNHLLGFGIQLLMYATPIIYPINSLDEKYQKIANLNPLSPIVESFRYACFGNAYFSGSGLFYSFIVMVFVLAIGIVAFKSIERTFIDSI
jgi:lipopolysaccharide transport system permease protein